MSFHFLFAVFASFKSRRQYSKSAFLLAVSFLLFAVDLGKLSMASRSWASDTPSRGGGRPF
jgi:hypothetical protein